MFMTMFKELIMSGATVKPAFVLIGAAGPTTSVHGEEGSTPEQHSPELTSPRVSGESGPALQCPQWGKYHRRPVGIKTKTEGCHFAHIS